MAEGSEVKENVKLWFKAVDAQTSGRHRDALEAYRQTDGKSARILYNMACAYVCLNKPVEAIEVSFVVRASSSQLITCPMKKSYC